MHENAAREHYGSGYKAEAEGDVSGEGSIEKTRRLINAGCRCEWSGFRSGAGLVTAQSFNYNVKSLSHFRINLNFTDSQVETLDTRLSEYQTPEKLFLTL